MCIRDRSSRGQQCSRDEARARARAGVPSVYGRTTETYNCHGIYTAQGSTVNTKLTLRLDDGLIRNAKRYSTRSGKSVSRLVADYFALIDSGEDVSDPEITPRVRSLIGSLKGATATEEGYRRHLEDKYR